jgi:SAM-dependent methyltransferase
VRSAWIVERIRREQSGNAPLRILDVGCGDGVLTRRVRRSFPQAAIRAVDLDEVRLHRATGYCPHVTFLKGDVCALPFVDAAFDVVLCHHVIEHINDDAGVLAECRRVLGSGGLLLLGIPQEGGAIGRVLRMIHRRLFLDGEHVNFYTIPTMRDRLAAAGFTRIEHAKFGFLFPYYYLHVLLVWNRFTFMLGHIVSQRIDATADSLMFAARKRVAA